MGTKKNTLEAFFEIDLIDPMVLRKDPPPKYSSISMLIADTKKHSKRNLTIWYSDHRKLETPSNLTNKINMT